MKFIPTALQEMRIPLNRSHRSQCIIHNHPLIRRHIDCVDDNQLRNEVSDTIT
jgi:hypothetical protein